MEFYRPIVMSLAGVDSCGGAGLFADIKTFEQHKVYGLGIATAQTVQTENAFFSIRWEKEEDILDAMSTMLAHYKISVVKIGIVQSIRSLEKIVSLINAAGEHIKIVLDPVIRSSTEFPFWKQEVEEKFLHKILQKITLITPNYKEVLPLTRDADPKDAAIKLSRYCAVLLKGGHNEEELGVDYLYIMGESIKLEPKVVSIFPKHGSGCVLSSSIAANLALGQELTAACRNAKLFTEKFLLSNLSLLGYHVI